MATIVFSNVGAAGFDAILSISARFSAIAASSAGLKSSILTLSNGGIPPYGPTHFSKSGFAAGAFVALVDSECEIVIKTNAPAHTSNAKRTRLLLNIIFGLLGVIGF